MTLVLTALIISLSPSFSILFQPSLHAPMPAQNVFTSGAFAAGSVVNIVSLVAFNCTHKLSTGSEVTFFHASCLHLAVQSPCGFVYTRKSCPFSVKIALMHLLSTLPQATVTVTISPASILVAAGSSLTHPSHPAPSAFLLSHGE